MAAEDREIELKFVCESSDIPAVLSAAPAGEDETRQLVSTYFDTPHQTLRKAGASLRIRHGGETRVQTLKRGAGFARMEHEARIDSDIPDLTRPHLAELLSRREHKALGPVFTVDLSRRRRLLTHGGAQIEMAIDEGEVRAGEGARTLCEVELELKSGPPEALFSLARELALAAPLYLSFEGKAAQGQALADGTVHTARRSGRFRLAAGATVAEAFQTIARDALTQIAANAALLRAGPSPEAAHQLRVAVRRLRSAMSTFKPVAADEAVGGLKGELKWLTDACGEARGLDVLIAETYAQALEADPDAFGLADLGEALEAARGRAHARAGAAVASARFRALVLEAFAWVEVGDWLTAADAAVRDAPVADFAAKALSHRHRRLLKAGRDLTGLDDEARHKVRIQAKKLRYAAEAFASLYDDKAARRYVAALKRLQDHLGAVNDAAGLDVLLRGAGLEGAALFAAGRLVGQAGVDKSAEVKKAAKAMAALARLEPFWPS